MSIADIRETFHATAKGWQCRNATLRYGRDHDDNEISIIELDGIDHAGSRFATSHACKCGEEIGAVIELALVLTGQAAQFNPGASSVGRMRAGDLMLTIVERMMQMTLDLARIETEVAENRSAVASAVALLQGLKAQLGDARLCSTDAETVAAISKLAEDLDANTLVLANAVVANTSAVPPSPSSGKTPAGPFTRLE